MVDDTSLSGMVGRSLVVVHVVRPQDLVTAWRDEHPEIEMVPVLSTSKLQLWCARACMLALGGLSLGQEYLIKHEDMAVLGSTVRIRVECVWWGGHKLTRWAVEASVVRASANPDPLASGYIVMRKSDRQALERVISTKLHEVAADAAPPALPTRHELPGWYRQLCDSEAAAMAALVPVDG